MSQSFIPQHWAIIVAAGSGQRMQTNVPKQYLKLGDKTILEHTLQGFVNYSLFKQIILVLAKDDQYWPQLPLATHKKITTVIGGKSRVESVISALQFLEKKAMANDWVWVHDGVRPLLTHDDLDKLKQSLIDNATGTILATPMINTLKQVNKSKIVKTVDRQVYWQALTPQVFRFTLLHTALQQALAKGIAVTDEAQAIELQGYDVSVIEGHCHNIKITRPEDMKLAALSLRVT